MVVRAVGKVADMGDANLRAKLQIAARLDERGIARHRHGPDIEPSAGAVEPGCK
jgi:hypothetical protein